MPINIFQLRPWSSTACIGFGGAFICIGAVSMVAVPSWMLLPHYLDNAPPENLLKVWTTFLMGLASFLIGVLLMAKGISRLRDAEDDPEPARSRTLYGRYLAGVGFVFFLDALINATGLAGFSWSVGQASPPFSSFTGSNNDTPVLLKVFGRDAPEATTVTLFLLLSMGFALMGALFYFANSLWSKIAQPTLDPFDASLFWGGLWFRLAEALIFTVVIFLFIRTIASEQFLILPLIALLVGMFLKAGEQMISGLANRLIAAFSQLFPAHTTAPVALKHHQIVVSALGKSDEGRRVFQEIVAAIGKLDGVHAVNQDLPAFTIHLLFDPSLIHVERINNEVRLHGVTPG